MNKAAIKTIQAMLHALNNRHISSELLIWFDAALAIIELAEACERWSYEQSNAKEIGEKRTAAKSKIIAALEGGIL